ncbi:sugar-binding transcriptional regulator [Salipaludibacillus sp. CUR1]|uniref:sugar-binding transcriptional regulator n=1 Tax=Salipaludibacillus sp. CUR1 TaxID=2820003 RepID=UPI001E3E701C|nr:sugar-binding transcriptional regulator [Salipaludibacillus sp. CUR1]MCE7792532.1 sugar-binding transcriptional regulator [Salipaludibacillus sp. CUR1]
MDKEKVSKAIEAARMYYVYDYTQSMIAEKLGVSRPTVSRLLNFAKEEGFIEITVKDPEQNVTRFEQMLEEAFGLKKAIVVHAPDGDDEQIKRNLGSATADYLDGIVKDSDMIGLTWGTTLYEIAKKLTPKKVSNVKVVQLKGSVSHSETNTYAGETLNLFGQAFNTVPRHLPIPAIVDHVVVKQAIEADRYIKNILDMGKEANIALYTIGKIKSESLLFQLGYFSEEDLKSIYSHAAGDICSRFFDENGKICSDELNARTLGINLEDLRTKEYSVLIAGGEGKLPGIRGALKGNYANVLVTDAHTAKKLLEEAEE